jgi:hypothetical protein
MRYAAGQSVEEPSGSMVRSSVYSKVEVAERLLSLVTAVVTRTGRSPAR